MKFKGKDVKGANKEIIVIPRPDENIVFVAEAIKNWEEFDKIISEPVPPEVIKPGNVKIKNEKDPEFVKAVEEYNDLRTSYLVVASLQNSPDIEWDTVNINDPVTWGNYEEELRDADFNDIEIGRIVTGVMRANCLDQSMIDEARANFLHGE